MEEILDEATSKMKAKKSTGPDGVLMTDGVLMIVMKDSYPVFKPLFLELFNHIDKERVIPPIWKKAIVTPIHKKGATDDISNYRPVLELCSISKLFERCIMSLMRTEDLEGSHQHIDSYARDSEYNK